MRKECEEEEKREGGREGGREGMRASKEEPTTGSAKESKQNNSCRSFWRGVPVRSNADP